MENLYCFTVRLAMQRLAPFLSCVMMANGISRLQSAKVRNVFFSQPHAFTCTHDELSNVCFTINYRHLSNAERSTKRNMGQKVSLDKRFLDGDEATFSCNRGYDLIGKKKLRCVGKVWDFGEPECKGEKDPACCSKVLVSLVS